MYSFKLVCRQRVDLVLVVLPVLFGGVSLSAILFCKLMSTFYALLLVSEHTCPIYRHGYDSEKNTIVTVR